MTKKKDPAITLRLTAIDSSEPLSKALIVEDEPEEIPDTIIERLIALVGLDGGRTQLAERLGMSRQNLTYWIKSNTIPLIRIQQIADEFGLTFEEVRALNPPPKRKSTTPKPVKARSGRAPS